MEGLTTKETLNKIIELYNSGFNFNAKCDRLSYVLSVSMNYPSLGNFVHKQFAHRIVGNDFADKIEEYGELRHDLFYRDALPVHVESFDSVSQLFEDLVLGVADIQNLCEEAIRIAAKNGDFGYEDLLRDINKGFVTKLLKQVMVLQDASMKYDRDNKGYKFEKDFKIYLLDEFKEDL